MATQTVDQFRSSTVIQKVNRPTTFDFGETVLTWDGQGDFCDQRVFVVNTMAHTSCVVMPRTYLGVHQQCDGPRYVMVGPDVPDDKLLRNLPVLAARYGVTLRQLKAARAEVQA